MAAPVTMPKLGLSMTEGTVVESEKAQVEIEAFASGTLAAVYVEPGTTVPVGTLLGALAESGEKFEREAFAASFVPEVAAPPAGTATVGPHPVPRPGGGPEPAGVKIAPAARALARRLGIDLATVAATGPGGRITVEDVQRAAPPVVEVNGTGLSVERVGSGPALLLVNGYGVDASAWRRQVDDLGRDHTVVTYDHRGIGHSWPAGEPALTLALLAGDARALLVHLGLLPGVVVGSSMGAAIALELALAHPEAVRGLVLVSPIIARNARFEAVLRAWREDETPASEARVRAMLPWLLGRELLAHDGRREAAAAAWRAMAARTPAASLRRHADALLAWLGTRTGELDRIGTPVLVIVGADDVLTTPAEAELVARGIRGARLEVLDGAGHAVMIERAEAVNDLVRAFVARDARR